MAKTLMAKVLALAAAVAAAALVKAGRGGARMQAHLSLTRPLRISVM
jgi:hypothetical protein